MIAKAGAADARQLRPRGGRLGTLRIRIVTQARKRSATQLRVVGGRLANKLEEQGQRTRCVFMLQRTMFR